MVVPFPLLFLIAVLSYQVSGWILGKRTFSSTNAEAMLFVFAACALIFWWWFLSKLDHSRSTEQPWTGRTVWWASMIVGGCIGTVIRLKGG